MSCELCEADGYPGQWGHSTNSCMADRIRYPEIYAIEGEEGLDSDRKRHN